MNAHELRSGAREIVDRGRAAQTPSDAQRERAYHALMAGIAGGGALGAAKAAVAKSAGGTAISGLKWFLVSAGVVALGAAGYSVSSHRYAPAPQDAPPVLASFGVASPAPPVTIAPTVSATSSNSAAPSAWSAPVSASKAPPPKTNNGDLSDELALLHRALGAFRSGDPGLALALAQEHAKKFPSSRLGVERDAIEVRSLCSLGRAAEAHRLADRLQAQAPSSPVRAALEETCVGK